MCEAVITDSIGHELKAINHLMQRQMFKAAVNAGIDRVTIMHGWIIGYLEKNRDRDVYQKDLEAAFSISRSSVTSIVKCMEKKGYIKRASVDSDARLKKLVLTEQGEELSRKIEQAVLTNEQKFDALLSSDEKETFLALVRKLKLGLENIDKQGVTA